MKRLTLTLLAAAYLTACSSTTASEKPEVTIFEEIESPASVQTGKTYIQDYLKLKDALVKTDAKAAKEAAAALRASFTAANLPKGLIAASTSIAQSDNVEAQRKSFKTITDELIKYVKENGAGQTVYVQYCPMAFGNTGANWLSDSKEVLNPYFGSRMLRCGTVKEELK